MRMWLVDPKKMCRKHLLGEHVELHMLVGSINKNKSIQGFIDLGLIAPSMIKIRHEQLVEEMTRRGYNHQSPIEQPDCTDIPDGLVNPFRNKEELKRRCKDCFHD